MNAIQNILKSWNYVALSAIVSLVVFIIATWLPNVWLLWTIWSDTSIALVDKVILPVRLLESITTNFTALSATYTVVIALLTGINVALSVYILRVQKEQLSSVGVTVGTFGILSGTVGMGCAACGSLIISSLFATAGGASALALLPLHGGEFGLLGVVLLGITTYFLLRHIAKPPVCEITTDQS